MLGYVCKYTPMELFGATAIMETTRSVLFSGYGF